MSRRLSQFTFLTVIKTIALPSTRTVDSLCYSRPPEITNLSRGQATEKLIANNFLSSVFGVGGGGGGVGGSTLRNTAKGQAVNFLSVSRLKITGLVTQRTRQQLPRVTVSTSLSFGITGLSQSFSCGYLRLKDRYNIPRGTKPASPIPKMMSTLVLGSFRVLIEVFISSVD